MTKKRDYITLTEVNEIAKKFKDKKIYVLDDTDDRFTATIEFMDKKITKPKDNDDRFDKLEKKVDQISADLNKLSKTVDTLSSDFATLSTTVNGLIQTVSNLSQTVDGLVQANIVLTQNLNQIANIVAKLSDTVVEGFKQVNQRLDVLEADVSDLKVTVADLVVRMERVEDILERNNLR
ncbi:hypothetical protein [Mycoplasmopsis agassizii]|uniref:Uncharacterized protein n=1 Tax=Mycoplasmopsis agassizii TaxID=33922 RepID=A0ABX4H498_9BACT|nr:hypothetical protein [Mycoplasmopsis agassizii]PAF54613.1 hypothetical protein CJF60_05065 [Mycoplasmopsis agassizii]SMC19384.1 hypothetical protein SAMN02745179_00892 [Mycoplasmopsis agassizii]